MIYVECHVIDHRTMKLGGSYKKEFTSNSEFSKWYGLAKKDSFVIINVMKYDPALDVSKTNLNYLKLVQLEKGSQYET
jgi:hypothetical protein